MAQRQIEEALVTALGQVQSLQEAQALYVRALDLGDMPAHEQRMIGDLLNRVRSARDFSGVVINRLIDRLDPFEDIYNFQPGEPVDLTPHGIIPRVTGFCNYQDNVTIQDVPNDTLTTLLNNKTITMETQKPADVATFFSDHRIRVYEGDAVAIRVQAMVMPNDFDNIADQVTVGLAIQDNASMIFPATFALNGYAVPVSISYSTTAYAGATWAANGARVVVRANGAVRITGRTVLVARLHKART